MQNTKSARVGCFGSPITVCGHWSGAGRVSSRAPVCLWSLSAFPQMMENCMLWQLSHPIGSPRQHMNILYKDSWTILHRNIHPATFISSYSDSHDKTPVRQSVDQIRSQICTFIDTMSVERPKKSSCQGLEF